MQVPGFLLLLFISMHECASDTISNQPRYKPLGCYGDKGGANRALGRYIVEARGLESCYLAVYDLGYDVFGVQNGGECWTTEHGKDTYDKYGESSVCHDGLGGKWANSVYQIRPKRFEVFQQIPSMSAMFVKAFEIGNEQFLLISNGAPKATAESNLYKLTDGRFALHQRSETGGVQDAEHFVTGGKHFLVTVALRFKKGATVYQWKGGKFEKVNEITNEDCRDINVFTTEGETFLAISLTFKKHVAIYKWAESNNNAIKVQHINLPKLPVVSTTIKINGKVYLAIGQMIGTLEIFTWDDGKFKMFQDLGTKMVQGIHTFEGNSGELLLAAANLKENATIFLWNGKQFVPHQSIEVHRPTYNAFVSFKDKGNTFLAVANYRTSDQGYNTPSFIYKMKGDRFVLYQELPTFGARGMATFTYKGRKLLAIANHRNNDRETVINSTVFIWK